MAILDVPFKSQLNQGYANLCSQATAAMLTQAYTGKNLTAAQVAIATKTADNKPKSLSQLVQMLAHYGIPATIALSPTATVSFYRQQLAAGKPCVALIRYKFLQPGSWFTGAHFVLLLAINDYEVVYHDPLFSVGKMQAPIARFEAAISDRELNLPYQAVIPLDPLPKAHKMIGVNIDPRQQHHTLSAKIFAAFGYVRFPILVREHEGQTMAQALSIYKPLVTAYKLEGVTSMIPLTHEIGLEGQGFNFEFMNAAAWTRFREMYKERVRQIVTALLGMGVVYQVMNEQDSEDPRASVVIPPVEYGKLFNETHALIKSLDPAAKVITGGFCSGADRGRIQYLEAKITKTDGVAFHPYGASANGMYQGKDIATLQTQINRWKTLNTPLYISEWGALGLANEPEDKMAQYIQAFVETCRAAGIVAAVYFAWGAQDEHPYNSYPVINADGSVRKPIYDALTKGTIVSTPTTGKVLRLTNANGLNLRSQPNTSASVVTVLRDGASISEIQAAQADATYLWLKTVTSAGTGWIAAAGGNWKVNIS